MSQLLSKTDAFAHTDLGADVLGWLTGCPVDSVVTPPGQESQPGVLSRGHYVESGGVVFVAELPQGTNDAIVGVQRHEVFPEDQEVQVWCYGWASNFAPANQHLYRQASVFGRAQSGGVVSAGTIYAGTADLDCYEFLLLNTNGLNSFRYQLIRWNAGVPTLLSETAAQNRPQGFASIPFRLRMRITGSVTVTVTCWAEHPGIGSRETQIFNVAEGGGSRITGAGRCGMTGGRDTDNGGGGVFWYTVVTSFQVYDVTAGAVVFRDEWIREQGTLAKTVTDNEGVVGRILNPDHSEAIQGSGARGDLKYASGECQALSTTGDVVLGGAADSAGDGSEWWTLDSPDVAYRANRPGAGNRLTISLWARIDTNRDGNELYDCRISGTDEYLYFGLRTTTDIGGQAAALLEARLGNGIDTLASSVSAGFVIADYLGEPQCWTITYNPSAPNGVSGIHTVIALWVGRGSKAIKVAEITGATSTLPDWPRDSSAVHVIGKREGFSGAAVDEYLDGAIEEVQVFYRVLLEEEILRLCDESRMYPDLPSSYQHEARWNFDGFELISGDNCYKPQRLKGVNVSQTTGPAGYWCDETGASDVEGLTPRVPAGAVVTWRTRPHIAGDGDRVSVKATTSTFWTRAGVLVRGQVPPGVGAFDAYALLVGEGSPAALQLFRVIAGDYELIAEQDPDTGAHNVSSGSPFTVELEAANDPLDPSGPVVLTPKLAGTLVTMIPRAASIFLDLAGNVRDTDQGLKINQAGAHGLIYLAGSATHEVLLDDFAIVDPTAELPDPRSFPNVDIPGEADGATGTLSDVIGPAWGAKILDRRAREFVDMESGRGKVLALETLGDRLLEFEAVGLSDAEIDAVLDFWDDHNGGEIPFSIDMGLFLRDGAVETFAFVEDSRRVDRRGRAGRMSFVCESRRG